jgi:hypothetical protein
MAKKSLRKSHDDMIRLLRHLVAYSTMVYGATNRTPRCQRDYLRAKKLIAEAPKAGRAR